MMRIDDWALFQERFGEHQLLMGGDPDLAMFKQNDPSNELSAIYIHGPSLALLERFSPGGWEDSAAPNGNGITLLVGAGDAAEHFGISLGL